jgi:tetratricopeptide (TPR) repeat protein
MVPGALVGGRFEIEEAIGAGGMGTVYRARDRADDRAVAVKIVHGLRTSDLGRFAREARLLAELRHPAIVSYVAHGAGADGAPWLAMEWLDGEDLGAHLARGPLGVEASVELGARIADALGYAHARGVVHRDIKPSNLFLVAGDVGRPKILDFGVARILVAGERALTAAGNVVGTLGYMAPEQARGEPDVDARADVFALGCVLYECASGNVVLSGEHPMVVLGKCLLEEPVPLGEVVPGVPEGFATLIARMLAKDARARPADGRAVAAALRALHEDAAGPSGAAAVEVRARPPALGHGELGVLSVILLCPPRSREEGAMDPTVTPEELDGTVAALRARAEIFGARLDSLADGTVLVTLAGASPTDAAVDRAAHAARCALALRALVPDATLALATGRGATGGRLPVGVALERAAAVLRRASAGRVHVDDATAALLGTRFEIHGDEHALVLAGEREVEAPRTLLRKRTPFVGRDRELGALLGTFDECVDEPVARAVLVTGAAGMGKTRLRQELERELGARAPLVHLYARADAIGRASPFGLIAGAVRRAAGILRGEPPAVQHDKLRRRVERHRAPAEARRLAEFLGELCGAPSPHAASVELAAAREDAMLMGEQMRQAWIDFVGAEAEPRPVLFVLEDLHWGDRPSVAFVDRALRDLADRPLMTVAFARPEVHEVFPKLWHERAVQEIKLPPLTRRAAELLVRAVLGDDPPPERVAGMIARAAGNAFFLEEIIRAVALGAGELPDSVVASAQARLEAFEGPTRRLLRAASVFGERFWPGAVRALLDAAGLDEALRVLEEREVVHRHERSRFAGEVEYAFRHHVVREAAYAMLTAEDAALGHGLAADWLVGAGERDPIVIAGHLERAGEAGRAVSWWLEAAEESLQGNDLAGALEHAERGVACGAAGETLGALRLVQAEAHYWRGDAEMTGVRSAEARALAVEGSDRWCQSLAWTATASVMRGTRTLVEVGALLRDHLQAAPHPSDALLRSGVRVAGSLGISAHYEEAYALLHAAEAAASARPVDPTVAAWLCGTQGRLAYCAGDMAAYLERCVRAAELFAAIGDVRLASLYRVGAGDALKTLGDYAGAEERMRESLAVLRRVGLGELEVITVLNLGLVCAFRGDRDEGRGLLRAALDRVLGRGEKRLEAFARLSLARIALLEGEVDEALVEADAAVAAFDAMHPIAAYAAAVRAHARIERGDRDGALGDARRAREMLDALGHAEEGDGFVRLTHAQALAAAGHAAEARQAIAEARARLLARADKISDAALRRSFLEGVAEHRATLELAVTLDGRTAPCARSG